MAITAGDEIVALSLAADSTNQPSDGPSWRSTSVLLSTFALLPSPGENTSISPLRVSPGVYGPSTGGTPSALLTKSRAAASGVVNTTPAAGQIACCCAGTVVVVVDACVVGVTGVVVVAAAVAVVATAVIVVVAAVVAPPDPLSLPHAPSAAATTATTAITRAARIVPPELPNHSGSTSTEAPRPLAQESNVLRAGIGLAPVHRRAIDDPLVRSVCGLIAKRTYDPRSSRPVQRIVSAWVPGLPWSVLAMGESSEVAVTGGGSGSSDLLHAMLNLSRFHREHEKFYASAPRQQAVILQGHGRTLCALADRWDTAAPSVRVAFSPFEGAEDLNDPAALQLDGVLFMEGEGEPAEITRIKRELQAIGDEASATGSWLASAMSASWGMAASLGDVPQVAGLLGDRHRIIANDWQAAEMSALAGRILHRVVELLERVEFAPVALRRDLESGRVSRPAFYTRRSS